MPVIDNIEIKDRLQLLAREKLRDLKKIPSLGIILSNNELASRKYIELKIKFASKIGIDVKVLNITGESLIDKDKISKFINSCDGVILQLPVANNDHLKPILSLIPINKDVDLLTEEIKLSSKVLPPTIAAIDLIIKYHHNKLTLPNNFVDFVEKDIDLKGQIVAVVGQGQLVGRPLNRYLEGRNATIISINKTTPNPQSLTAICDIVICAAGSSKLITKNWLKKNTLVIDASTSEENNKLVGDIDYENIDMNDIFLCKSPGGIGPLTVMFLFWNLIKFAKVEELID